ncbi:zinc finger protein GFI1 homolog pag-3-like isoform X2 [Alligator mississippiensis]|uniref:zinc finger protein GFI1 homolog pag-3-like isoform X2 n=1 Tax=Alligator mississippiensis TaxID=8496 RepID=UPI002877CA60|nr:zinc finger protein GFI1 homolog pag-3-like isoform X2 [Alligator mississippiensis]
MHTQEKLHQYSVCGKSFTQSYSLTTHEHFHTGEKPYQRREYDKMQDARHILVVTPWDPTPALSAPHLQTSLCGSRETGPSGAPGPEARLPPAHQACHSFCRKAICLTGDKVKRHLE